MAATHVSLTMARFDTLQTAGPVSDLGIDGVLFHKVGADTRAAGTAVSDKSAYKFLVLGLHCSLESAVALHERRIESAPWLAEAKEVWSSVLVPVRHVGAANFLDQASPGLMYDCSADYAPDGPLVVMTSAGFDRTEGWMDRAKVFGEGVSAVRMAMFGTPGLVSTQSFFMDGAASFDGVTVTVWNSFAELRDAMYGPGVHKDWLLKQKAEPMADRTSFTRFVVERSDGAWHGSDPLGQN